MKNHRTNNSLLVIAACGLCAGSFLLSDLTPRTGHAQSAPTAYTLHGVVRDFSGTHPDFNVPTSAFSYTAGSVDPELGPNGKPKGLSKAESHGSNGMSTANVTVSKWGLDDASPTTASDNKGGHDGTINGAVRVKGRFGKALWFDGVDDYVEVPHHSDFLLDNATVTFYFNAESATGMQSLLSKDSSDYDTGGHCTIYIENGRLAWRLQSTSNSYFVYSPSGSVVANQWHHVAASFGPEGMRLYLDGVLVDSNAGYTGGLGISSGGSGNHEPMAFGVGTRRSANLSIAGWDEPFRGTLDEIQIFSGQIQDTEFNTSGGYIVASRFANSAGYAIAPHLYGAAWCTGGAAPPPCIDPATDLAGAVGNTDSGGMTTTASFDEWFNDVLGTNISARVSITLLQDSSSGEYEYLNDMFYPIDGTLLGNEGEAHNFNFTYTFCGTFTYEECTGQFFEFTGGDGSWLFVDGKLALDQSGAGTLGGQRIELDRLCLVDGQTYSLDFFFAQRQTVGSVFRLRTNVVVQSCNKPVMVFSPYD